MSWAILLDVTKCKACEKCVLACTMHSQTDPWQLVNERALTKDGLSAQRPATIVEVADGRFARKSCMHCLEPSCVSACLVGGITKNPLGPVVYDPSKCIGCRYCMLACPFHIPRYEWEKPVPYMVKCDMCADRLRESRLPACVEACPEDALIFGDRGELLRKAHVRIAKDPARYVNHVWGEHEFGGTSVLYISDVDLDAIGWPAVTAESIPSLTEPLIHKTPFIGFGVAIGLVGLNWIIKRRDLLARERARQAGQSLKQDNENED
jgi:formate dehydrogenase iron-sulfur subunit